MPRQGLWLKWIKMEPRSQIFPTIICGVEAIDDPSFPPTQRSFHQYPTAGHIVSCAHEFGCSHRGAMPIRYGRQNCGPKRVLHEPQLRFVVRCSGTLQVHPRLDQILHFRTHHSDPSQLVRDFQSLVRPRWERGLSGSVSGSRPLHNHPLWFGLEFGTPEPVHRACSIYSTVPIRKRRWR